MHKRINTWMTTWRLFVVFVVAAAAIRSGTVADGGVWTGFLEYPHLYIEGKLNTHISNTQKTTFHAQTCNLVSAAHEQQTEGAKGACYYNKVLLSRTATSPVWFTRGRAMAPLQWPPVNESSLCVVRSPNRIVLHSFYVKFCIIMYQHSSARRQFVFVLSSRTAHRRRQQRRFYFVGRYAVQMHGTKTKHVHNTLTLWPSEYKMKQIICIELSSLLCAIARSFLSSTHFLLANYAANKSIYKC